MAFLVNCFIRKNTPEIREHLERGGLSICQCCTFDEESFKNDDYLSGGESVWLQTYTRNGTVHGVGYWDESAPPRSTEEACEFFLDTTHSYDCGENEGLFYALAFLRGDNDSDQFQWFIFPDGTWRLCDCQSYIDMWGDYEPEDPRPHKATKEDIIRHFN